MSDVDSRDPATAYATKDNIVVPPESGSATQLTALAARAVGRMNDGLSRPTVTAVKTLKKG